MLPAASLLIFANGQMQARRYWIPAISYQSSVISYQLSVISHQPSAISTELEAVRQLFNESVARSVAAGRPFSLALTGGMDARAVLSALVAAGIRPPTVIHAVSGSTDALLAAELAQRAGAEHHFFEVRGEALPDLIRPGVYALGGQVAAIDVHPLCFLADLLRFTEVMFTGLGAEVTRGEYPAADADPRHDTPATVARKMLASYGKVFGPETDLPALLNEDWQPGLLSRPLRSMEEAIAAAGDVPLTEVSGVADLQERVPRFWVKGELIVRRELETRHPFLNRPLMMRIWSLPRAVRWAGLAHRYIITRNAPALADVPYEHDGLPLRYPFTRGDEWRLAWKRARRRITDRLGQPYRRVPNYRYADWLRGPLRPLLTDVLLDPAATTRPYFKPGAVQKLYHEHIAGQDHTTKLAALLALELTVRMFMETS
jgi:asparagine synthetase B (glutamine-hydrolysing)